jgi:hypothetical protein
MTKKFWTTVLTFGLPWAVLMIIFKSIEEGELTLLIIVSNLIGGLFAGLLFAWIMPRAGKRLFKTIVIDTADDEVIIKEGAANHFKGIEGVGGKLVLTDKRLIFKSHKLNIQNHQENFALEEIQKLIATKTLGVLKNGLTVELTSNNGHRFIVDEPTDWIEKIVNQKRLRDM